jgi:hypothetical protein
MNKNFFLYVGAGTITLVIILGFSLNQDVEFMPEQSLELDFKYMNANSKLKEILEIYDISMSVPVELKSPNSIEKYCSFFEDENKQKLVEYCTSTELLDSEGNFIGNIHMVGSTKLPKLVLVAIQADPFMKELSEIKSVFSVVIETLVCNCWDEIKPSDINTIDEWIDRHREFHSSAIRTHSKSTLELEGKQLQIELTTNTEGYLWKLLISR